MLFLSLRFLFTHPQCSYVDESLEQWSNYEAKAQQDLEQQVTQTRTSSGRSNTSSSTKSSTTTSFDTNRTCAHTFFISYAFLAMTTAVLLGLAQLLGFTIKDMPSDINQGLRYCISIYLILMCFLSVLTELEWFAFIINSRILSFWVTRGLLYIFMGLLSLDQLHNGSKKSQNQTLFIKSVSYIFMGVGAGYAIMGVLCFQIVLKRIRLDYRARRYGYKTSNCDNNENQIPDTSTDLVLDDDKEFS